MFQRLSRLWKPQQPHSVCRDNKSATPDLGPAGYLAVLSMLFCLEMLSGCATPRPAMSETTGNPEIDISAEYQQALQHMQAEQWQDARENLARLTQQDPSLSGPWVNLGITRTMLGDRSGAEAAFKYAIDCGSRSSLGL